MTVYVNKNSDINTVIPPISVRLAQATWKEYNISELVHTGKFSLLPAEKNPQTRCFSYFL